MSEHYIPPGLVRREIIDTGGEMVTIQETWDPRVEGCPLMIFDQTVWPWVKRDDVAEVVHRYPIPRGLRAKFEAAK